MTDYHRSDTADSDGMCESTRTVVRLWEGLIDAQHPRAIQAKEAKMIGEAAIDKAVMVWVANYVSQRRSEYSHNHTIRQKGYVHGCPTPSDTTH